MKGLVRHDGVDWLVFRLARARGFDRNRALGMAAVAAVAVWPIDPTRELTDEAVYDAVMNLKEELHESYFLEHFGNRVSPPEFIQKWMENVSPPHGRASEGEAGR